jgi:hypothetical protein
VWLGKSEEEEMTSEKMTSQASGVTIKPPY